MPKFFDFTPKNLHITTYSLAHSENLHIALQDVWSNIGQPKFFEVSRHLSTDTAEKVNMILVVPRGIQHWEQSFYQVCIISCVSKDDSSLFQHDQDQVFPITFSQTVKFVMSP